MLGGGYLHWNSSFSLSLYYSIYNAEMHYYYVVLLFYCIYFPADDHWCIEYATAESLYRLEREIEKRALLLCESECALPAASWFECHSAGRGIDWLCCVLERLYRLYIYVQPCPPASAVRAVHSEASNSPTTDAITLETQVLTSKENWRKKIKRGRTAIRCASRPTSRARLHIRNRTCFLYISYINVLYV
jgi:hypothetical protein